MVDRAFPNLNRVSLGGLRAVETVARLGTVRAAADALNVTPGAVSQQVLKAESQLGRTLFNRSSSGLAPTEIGHHVATLLADGFSKIDQAVAFTSQSKDLLSISAAPVLAARWLVPRLPELEASSDGLRVNVDAVSNMVQPGVSGIDACLRVAREAEISALPDDQVAIWLADHIIFPVCAPQTAQKIRTISDLGSVPVITDRHSKLSWNMWLKHADLSEDQLQRGTTYSDASLCLDAAIAGGGVFLAWDILAADSLAKGALVKPFKTVAASGLSYWFIRQKRSNQAKRLEQLEHWLKASIAKSLPANFPDV